MNAARHIDAMVRTSGLSWETLVPDDKANQDAPGKDNDDLLRLDELLSSDQVADVLKMRLRDMRILVTAGKISPADRRFLRILHRKAVIDGVIVEH